MVKKVANIEVENKPEVTVKAELVEKTYTVYAPFFLFDKEFGVGEKFHAPFNFQPADKIESVQRKGRPNRGTSFSINGKIIVLPVE